MRSHQSANQRLYSMPPLTIISANSSLFSITSGSSAASSSARSVRRSRILRSVSAASPGSSTPEKKSLSRPSSRISNISGGRRSHSFSCSIPASVIV